MQSYQPEEALAVVEEPAAMSEVVLETLEVMTQTVEA